MDNKQQLDKIINIPLQEWQVRQLKSYFTENDKTALEHWAYSSFDKALKTESVPTPEAPDKIPSVKEYFKLIGVWDQEIEKNTNEKIDLSELMESYALLREQRAVEQAKKEWEKEKSEIIKEMAKSLIEHTEKCLSYPMNMGGNIEFQKGYRKSQTEYIEFMKMVYKTE